MRIYLVDGSNCPGWAIDTEATQAARFLTEIGHTITANPLTADVIHFAWWNALLKWPRFLLRLKRRVVATASNEIVADTPGFLEAKELVSLWVAPSHRQFSAFRDIGVPAARQPSYVDYGVFKPNSTSKEEICARLNIPWESMRGRFIFGSFQRDTEGSDLSTPKWQKNPQLLIKLLAGLPDKDRWVLLLAGPRRHFVVAECRRLGIPFMFFGTPPQESVDDLLSNIQPAATMAELYGLVDCYLVTSKSEGGPRAVVEAAWCRTPVLSTDVGLAADILDPRCIFRSEKEFHQKIVEMIQGGSREDTLSMAEKNFNSVSSLCGSEITRARWKAIYRALLVPRLDPAVDHALISDRD